MKAIIYSVLLGGFTLFLFVSLATGYQPGKEMGKNLIEFLESIALIIPAAFILIGLFEEWVKNETIERHLGKGRNWTGFLWALLLAGTSVGGLWVSFPVAHSLYKKGASYQVIFTYITASGVVRIPMTFFEISFLGPEFTLLRYAMALPLVLITSVLLGRYLSREGYRLPEG
ncbi:MAG: permease [Spirochaetales bacterium]|nr:permease [Spirochaetales bacterium]MCF7939898.1 permease [Spirochaetales bacterium]